MAAELVNSATSSKLTETDWSKNIEICSLVAHDHRQAKDVVKAIKKRLASKNQNSQLFAVLLLEMLMNNIGESVHKQVIDIGILPILVKVVMKKSDHPARERIFLLLDAAQTSLGGASGRFPQYYVAYYELVSAGVQFPQRPRDIPRPNPMSKANKKNPLDKEPTSPNTEKDVQQAQCKKVSEASALEKACAAMELLRDVVNTIDTQNPEGAKDEFTLDLVEQCCFAKQRVMHLAVTSLDIQIVLRAVEINEQLGILLRKHDALLDRRPIPTTNPIDNGHELKDEEAEQLYRRIQKGKACMRPEDEEPQVNSLLGLMSHSIVEEMLHRPLIRPLRAEEPQRDAVAIPPPPAKHVEREKFFEEIKATDGHMMRSPSLHSRNASSSRSASTDFSE